MLLNIENPTCRIVDEFQIIFNFPIGSSQKLQTWFGVKTHNKRKLRQQVLTDGLQRKLKESKFWDGGSTIQKYLQ